MGLTSARPIRLRTWGQSYKKTLTATNVFDFLVKKHENLPPKIKYPALFFIESEERCCLNTASVLQGDDNEVIDTFPVEDNPKDFDFSLPDKWGGD